jgi:hypothetical protein
MWLREEEHLQIVQNSWKTDDRHLTDKLKNTLEALHDWGVKKFGSIPRKIKQTQDQLQNLTNQSNRNNPMYLIRDKEREMDNLLQ